MRVGLVIAALWIAFAVSWLAAMPWSNATLKRAGIGAELSYRIVLLLGGVASLVPAHNDSSAQRLWHISLWEAWACTGIIALGFAFSWWARIHLGALWSGPITKKADHRVIDTGPYRIVRHPIYTGILLAVLATAAAKGTILGLAGAFLIALGLWMKARLEERWLSQELGENAYAAYRRRVPMLVPFGPRSAQ